MANNVFTKLIMVSIFVGIAKFAYADFSLFNKLIFAKAETKSGISRTCCCEPPDWGKP